MSEYKQPDGKQSMDYAEKGAQLCAQSRGNFYAQNTHTGKRFWCTQQETTESFITAFAQSRAAITKADFLHLHLINSYIESALL